MRASSVISAILLITVSTWAATIIEPARNTSWDASNQGQNVAWTFVATDPDSFSLMLMNDVSSHLIPAQPPQRSLLARTIHSLSIQQINPRVSVIVKQNVSTSAGSTIVNGPAAGWPTGEGFQINVVQENSNGTAILAQSQQFNITGNTVAFSSVKPSSTST
jgi:hypothetical protein